MKTLNSSNKTYATKSTAKRALKKGLEHIDLYIEDVMYDFIETDDGFMPTLTFFAAEVPDDIETLFGFTTVYLQLPAPRNGYIHENSDHGGVCAEVWAIADNMAGAPRKDVIAACRDAGIAYGTARTQYQKWKSKRG